MKLYCTGGVYGDEMCSFLVKEYKSTDVEGFIREVLSERQDEWGTFKVMNSVLPFNPEYEYKNGKFNFSSLHTDIRNLCITEVKSHGGWSNMDYTIYTTKIKFV